MLPANNCELTQGKKRKRWYFNTNGIIFGNLRSRVIAMESALAACVHMEHTEPHYVTCINLGIAVVSIVVL